MANQKDLAAGLQEALKVLEEGHTEEAVSRVTSIKQDAAVVSKELNRVQTALCQLREFYTHQRDFLSHHIKIQEKKEREIVISKSISESIQRSQHKKLQACKWALMKARNALYLKQKKLSKQERESIVNGFHNVFLEADSKSLEELRATVQNVESDVKKLEVECTRLENTSLDTLRKIAELKNKHELASQETKCLKELYSTREQYIQQIQDVEGFMKQATSLWTLCKKAFDNGCKREDVLNAIARQAKETATVPHHSDSTQTSVLQSYSSLEGGPTVEGAINLLQFNPQCLMCGEHMQQASCLKCEHCSSRTPEETLSTQKVTVDSFTCTSRGCVSGTLWVANIAYDKHVLVRYSQNSWLSSEEVVASYESSAKDCDCFKFELPFSISVSLCLEFAVRYQVAGAEYWDNNRGRNYRIFF